jgi:large subunit ribosomal protein L25
LKKGGVLNIVLRRVEVVCDNEKSIPTTIEIDIAPLHIGSKVRASDLKLPAGVKLLKKSNFLIASITGRGKSDDDSAAAAQAAATATAPAAKAEDKK